MNKTEEGLEYYFNVETDSTVFSISIEAEYDNGYGKIDVDLTEKDLRKMLEVFDAR